MTDETPQKKDNRTLFLVVGALVVAWIIWLAVAGPKGPMAGELPPPNLTAPGAFQADYGWTLQTPAGDPVDFARYRGKTVFLNLWATWCPPCRMEMPAIVNLANQSRVDDVVFLAVSTDEDADTLRSYLNREKMPGLTVLRAEEAPPDIFLTDGIPATFIIAPDGRIAAAHVGAAQWDDPKVADFLESLSRPKPKVVANRPNKD